MNNVGYVVCQKSNNNGNEIIFIETNNVMIQIIGGHPKDKFDFVFSELIHVIQNEKFLTKELKSFSIYANKWYKVKIINLIDNIYQFYFYHISNLNLDYDEKAQALIINNELNLEAFNHVYEEDKALVLAEYHRYLYNQEFNVEYRINGNKWVHTRVLKTDGIVISEDITSRKNIFYHLVEKERILSAIVYATNEIMINSNYIDALKTSLALIGKALGLDQIKFFQLEENMMAKQLFIWSYDKICNQLNEFQMLKEYYEILRKGEIINELVKDASLEAKKYFDFQARLSILMIPIFVYKKLWGFMSFEEFKFERLIVDDKLSLLKLFASSIGKAIERKQEENDKEFLSYHDSLTGLYNRRYFDYHFKLIDIPSNLPLSIIVADVNGLKLTNDAFGHLMGDKILKEAANVFETVCKDSGIIARWGGDEFLILLPRTDQERAANIVKEIQEISAKRYVNSISLSISTAFDTKTNSSTDIIRVLKNAEDLMYKQKLVESSSTRSKTVYAIIHALHEKNQREEQHSKRVSDLCIKIGVALNLNEMAISKLKAIGLLHDIGKIALSDEILNKPGKLNETEWEKIKRHSEIGYRILSSSNDLKEIAEYVLHHHERLDGTGYPSGLKGDEIPLYSRILAVADAYDAMTSVRPYRDSLSKQESIIELIKNACTHFDINIVRVLIEKVLKADMYKVINGAGHSFVVKGDLFNPLEGITISDSSDPKLSINDLKIAGLVNEKVCGLYKLIYSIQNRNGDIEKLERIVIVGKLSMFPYNNNLLENNKVALSKSQLDSAIFNMIVNSNSILIELYNGGQFGWSAQSIFSGITFKKGETYIVSFDAKAELTRIIHLSIGWLEIRHQEHWLYKTDFIWHSFIGSSNNIYTVNNVKQTYSLEFTMNEDTFTNSDLKFEFGNGEPNKILLENIIVTKKSE